MATCQMCGSKTSGFFTELCTTCQASRENAQHVAATAARGAEPRPGEGSEGGTARALGKAILWLSLIGGLVGAALLSRTSVPDGLYGSRTVWNPTLAAIFIGAGLNGAFFGFLLAKVGSVLVHLESLRNAQRGA